MPKSMQPTAAGSNTSADWPARRLRSPSLPAGLRVRVKVAAEAGTAIAHEDASTAARNFFMELPWFECAKDIKNAHSRWALFFAFVGTKHSTRKPRCMCLPTGITSQPTNHNNVERARYREAPRGRQQDIIATFTSKTHGGFRATIVQGNPNKL